MMVIYLVAVLMLLLGFLILLGRGDGLIAGYNTVSEQERDGYDVRRLRLLVGGVLVILALLMTVLGVVLDSESMATASPTVAAAPSLIFTLLVVVLAAIVVILSNTWARRK